MDSGVAVTLFRHGVTKANLEKRYLGWSDPPITDEARHRLTALPSEVYDLCVSSDLIRCRQTATIRCPDAPYVESAAFREMHFGNWELKTYAELCHDPEYRNWLNDSIGNRPPDGESFSEMESRVDRGWNALKKLVNEEGYRNSLLVTHGGVIRLLLTKLAKERKNFWEWEIPHGTGIKLYWVTRDWRENSRCTSLQVVPITESENG
ncbi:alpha-ribazole phosphatase [Virgibacillus natechei]|uniref:phosphoglycerate mutase (2,3-diphosphoglycerate-dependent) n=1 Tax=Virgibacillus natechei TaxID=1216297 RepID=A0ABS4IG91_9BACI|nr:histidine phosphatase family protein [Virgibacillus natechei]MBP1969967.1 alpha-ribazole phosphatase [Virgibacillus natechei]UZD13373.1 histidine phosphatase family protein [Virgibacillus natechei]